MTNENYTKLAQALGRVAAKNAMEKDAFLGAVKGLWGALGSLAGRGLGSAGEKVISAGRAIHPNVGKWLATAGKGAPSDMLQFGVLGGAANALFSPDDRMGAFGRGFAGGALGGLGWRGGVNVSRALQNKYMPKLAPNAWKSLSKWRGTTEGAGKGKLLLDATAKRPHWWQRLNIGKGREYNWGDAAKGVGARMATGAVPLAAAFIGSDMLTPSFSSEEPQQSQYQYEMPKYSAAVPSLKAIPTPTGAGISQNMGLSLGATKQGPKNTPGASLSGGGSFNATHSEN